MRLVLRCDAGAGVGFGHLRRCQALADAAGEAGHEALFLMPREASCEAAMRSETYAVRWIEPKEEKKDALRDCLKAASAQGPAWAVVDDYESPEDQLRAAEQAGAKTLAIDDWGGREFPADLILQPGLSGSADKPVTDAQRLVGGEHILLRRAFWDVQPVGLMEISPIKCLVTLGGSDKQNRILRIITAMHQLPAAIKNKIEMTIILGHAFNAKEKVTEAVQHLGTSSVQVHHGVQDMLQFYLHANAVVCAAGTTVYECARLGLPMWTVLIAENQRANASTLEQMGMARVFGFVDESAPQDIAADLSHFFSDIEGRKQLAKQAASQIDGQGARRVIRRMQELTAEVSV